MPKDTLEDAAERLATGLGDTEDAERLAMHRSPGKPYLFDTRLRAGQIHILLHHYIFPEPYPYPSEFYSETVARFKRRGILDEAMNITPSGRDFVDRLMQATCEPVFWQTRALAAESALASAREEIERLRGLFIHETARAMAAETAIQIHNDRVQAMSEAKNVVFKC